MANRKQRRHTGKPHSMSYAEQIANRRMLREAAQNAANDLTVQVKADVHTQKMNWLTMLALNDAFQFGASRYQRLAEALTARAEWYNDMVKGGDEEYANEKMRQEVERVTHERVDFAWEDEIRAAQKKHENDRLTNYERLKAANPVRMAEILCSNIACDGCPGEGMCKHTDRKADGLIKWLDLVETEG